MIRRGFWLALGAVLGVTGYRRATRIARAMVPARWQPGPGQPGPGQLARAGFLRDVREGRAEYLDRHLVLRGPTLESQQIRDQPPRVTSGTGAYTGIDYAKDGR
jgi:hypothetical protein